MIFWSRAGPIPEQVPGDGVGLAGDPIVFARRLTQFDHDRHMIRRLRLIAFLAVRLG